MYENKSYKASFINKGGESNQHLVIGKRITDRIKAVKLIIANKELAYQSEVREKCASDLIAANEEIVHQNEEKENRAAELILANKELVYQNEEKENRATELILANEELAYQNEEKENRAAELILANKELVYQNGEKENRAAELVLANEELAYQNAEKENRAAELVLANEELAYQNAEKEKRAAELILANKELAVSNAELEQFIFVASHDLQEPLRMITSFMTQLEKKYGDVVDEKGRQYINFAMDGAKRMRQIILDLLSFSVAGSVEDDIEEVDCEKLINEIIAQNHRQAEELQARFNLGKLPVIETYRKPLRQVFQNLVSNSLKYCKQGKPPVISITCKQTKTHVRFAIKDNCIGIASEYFDKIFIIFQRLHNRDEYSGTGMGLAITKKIVENLGGEIWVKSEEGEGSTFYFTILKNAGPCKA
jgi:signal transduction histidine kinase